MTKSIYNPINLWSLFAIHQKKNNDWFKIVNCQTDNILFLVYKMFIIKKEEQLYKANLLAKKREKLDNNTIKFNDSYIKHKSNMIYLTQKK